MEFNVFTWNVDWFRNGQYTGGKSNVYNYQDCKGEIFNQLCKEVRDFFKKNPNNPVAFIQEFPFKYKENEKWHDIPYWNSLNDEFPIDKYDVFESSPNEVYVYRKVVAIANKGIFERNNEYNDNNRLLYLNIKDGDMRLIGVHMPTVNCLNKDKEDIVWRKLISDVKGNKKVIIAGDFNTYIGCDSKSTEYRYKELLSLADNIVVESIKTFNDITSVDKILVGKDLNIKSYGVIPQEVKGYKDHRYITARIIID